ncbi:CarD family transcriptional regulator [Salirhabdus salicampi]|uniref:CarD family transcriptional regulator n=1 Tax=Salirhabdus salicampi TaxID=476102 RepID=UPI0020C54D0F|nr:CarD family transcriptional regulator [Salirhabdus salicampi]MCP8616216.1 transcription factor YdeB [Salirhabdus salicampi]
MEVDILFQVGSKIVYPMHGAGVIESVEEKEIFGKKEQYFIIKLKIDNMKVMIPESKIATSNIRPVVDQGTLKDVLDVMENGETDSELNSKQRYTTNMEKMKTGSLQDGVEVVRDLTRLNQEKALNTNEKQMLDNARKIVISELGLIKGISDQEAGKFIEDKTVLTGS